MINGIRLCFVGINKHVPYFLYMIVLGTQCQPRRGISQCYESHTEGYKKNIKK